MDDFDIDLSFLDKLDSSFFNESFPSFDESPSQDRIPTSARDLDDIPSSLRDVDPVEHVNALDGFNLSMGFNRASNDGNSILQMAGIKRARSGSHGEDLSRPPVPTNTVHSSDDYRDIGDILPTGDVRNFRIQGKSFHLTYRGFINHEQCLGLLGGTDKLQYWSVVWELGSHGDSPEQPYEHTHFFFRTRSRLDRTGSRTFDIGDTHPHVQKVSGEIHEGRIYHQYHKKAPVQLWQSAASPSDPSLLNDRKKLRETIQRGTLLDACMSLGIAVQTVSDVRAIREERVPPEPAISRYEESDFLLKVNWMTTFEGHLHEVDTILMYGPSGLGKTERAVSLFKRPLLVRSLDSARDYHPDRYDGIVFDDVNLSSLSPEEKIHLVDSSYAGVVRCRYSNGIIPPGTKRIFTTNRSPTSFFSSGPSVMEEEQLRAVFRRIKIIHVASHTFNHN